MRKNTDVSRLRIAVTSATSASATTSRPRGPTGTRARNDAGRGEEPVRLGDDADQQQAGDERERRPDLPRRSGQAGQFVSGC